jgi:hypothetical protein
MPKSIPTLGLQDWGTPLNAHLAQLQNPTNGGINTFEQFSQRPNTLTADDAGKTYLYSQTGNLHQWTGTAWKVLNESVINVKDYGAVGDGVVDDTVAIQGCLNLAKGLDGTSVGRTVFNIYIPTPKNGFYKITDTLVIDGTPGLKVYGDGAFSYRDHIDSKSNSTLTWFGNAPKPIIQILGEAYVKSNPNYMINIFDLTISGCSIYVDPGTQQLPLEYALSGIHLGGIIGQDMATLNRTVNITNCFIQNCRFGIWSGNITDRNTDHSVVSIDKCTIFSNFQSGIKWGTGNAIVNINSCHIGANGWKSYISDSYSNNVGANINVESGYVDIYSNSSFGHGIAKPLTADIFQSLGRVAIHNAWSEVENYFFFQEGGGTSLSPAQITGIRHYNGSFLTEGAPLNSLHLRNPGMVVSSSSFYGNIVVESGQSGRPVFSGIVFLNPNSTYTGSGITAQRSLTAFGTAGNASQMILGGANGDVKLTHKGDLTPQILSMGTGISTSYSVLQALGADTNDSGFTLLLDADSGALIFLINCYKTLAGYKPIKPNVICWKIQLGGTAGITSKSYNPNGSALEFQDSNFI